MGQRRGEKKKHLGQGGCSSAKRAERAHPQLVHWWLLIHSSPMLRPTSYFKIYISSTFSPLCQAASTRCQLWPALLGSPFSSLGAITGTQCWVSSTYALGMGGRTLPSGMGILEHLQRGSVCDSRQ